MSIEDTPVPPSRCVVCDTLNDKALGIEPDARPTPGCFSLCDTCGHIAVFAHDLTLREPTDQEMHEIAGRKDLLFAQEFRAWKAQRRR
jgi:hypothetical protein